MAVRQVRMGRACKHRRQALAHHAGVGPLASQRLLAELALMDAAQAKIASPNRPKRPQILGRVREEQAEAEVAGGPRLSVSCMLLVWIALGWMSFLWTVRNPSMLYPLLPPLVMAGCEPAPRCCARSLVSTTSSGERG